MHLLCFSLKDKEYAVNIDSVREVRRIRAVTPIPGALDFIEGVVSLRGKVVPIVNLRKKLGLPSDDNTAFHRVLIVEAHDHILGIAVDGIVGVISVDAANIEAPDEVLYKAEYLIGVAKIGKRLILVADMEKLLSLEDKSGLKHVHSKVELKKKA